MPILGYFMILSLVGYGLADIQCPPSGETVIPYEEDPAKFYKCDGGKAILLNCGEGYEFSTLPQKCVKASTKPPLCPYYEHQFNPIKLPHETDKTKYYSCFQGDRQEKKCRPGTEFQVRLQTCKTTQPTITVAPIEPSTETATEAPTIAPTNAPTEAPTVVPTEAPTDAPTEAETIPPTEPPTEPHICPPNITSITLHPDPLSCYNFYVCHSGDGDKHTCGTGLEFDPIILDCVPISANGCSASQTTSPPTDPPTDAPTAAPTEAPTDAPTEAPTDAPTVAPTDAPTVAPTDAPTEAPTVPPTDPPTEPQICPPNSNSITLHPDPLSCYSFYVCRSGNADKHTCGTGLEFDPIIADCVPISENGCSASQTTSPPTDPPTDVPTVPPTDPPTEPQICPPNSTSITLHPDPWSCYNFYVCRSGNADKHTCGTGLEFDPIILDCVPISANGCSASQTTSPPTDPPTDAPTAAPTEAPTDAPTVAPTDAPTEAPTDAPTEAPTDAPTEAPTGAPTEAPTIPPTEPPTEPQICPPNSNFITLHPDPLSCYNFYVCLYGNGDKYTCDTGLEFDPIIVDCVPISTNGCSTSQTTSPPTDPPTDAPTAAPTEAPTDAPTEAPTDAPTEAPTDAPTEAPTVPPTDPPTEPQLCPPNSNSITLHPDPLSCYNFYVCRSGNADKHTCGTGLEFDPIIANCVPISANGCSASQTTSPPTDPPTDAPTEAPTDPPTEPQICPPNSTFITLHPDPWSCYNFYVCRSGNADKHTCGSGLEFDPIIVDCVPISANGCSASQTTPTDPPTNAPNEKKY